jgi:ribulose 1,5-bisphosphate synthetase/thiazole synthase
MSRQYSTTSSADVVIVGAGFSGLYLLDCALGALTLECLSAAATLAGPGIGIATLAHAVM